MVVLVEGKEMEQAEAESHLIIICYRIVKTTRSTRFHSRFPAQRPNARQSRVSAEHSTLRDTARYLPKIQIPIESFLALSADCSRLHTALSADAFHSQRPYL